MLLSRVWAFSAAVHVCSSGCPSPTQSRSAVIWAVPHASPSAPLGRAGSIPVPMQSSCSTSTASSPAPLARVCQNFGPCDVLVCLPEGTEVSPARRVPLLPHCSLPLQICGGFRAETCTPARCEGLLCPRDNSTACRAGRPCRGIFPLSSGALATAGEAAREFRSLSTRLRETAQLVSAGSAACPTAKPHTPSFGVKQQSLGGQLWRERAVINTQSQTLI